MRRRTAVQISPCSARRATAEISYDGIRFSRNRICNRGVAKCDTAVRKPRKTRRFHTEYILLRRSPMIRTRLDGFSLVELMIVVGLIAVLAGVAAPQVAAGMRQYSLISATQEVGST